MMRPPKENAPAGTRATNTTNYTRKYKRFPPYGKKLMLLRRSGKIPKRMVVVVFDWELARAWPRIVIPDDMSYEGLNFDYLGGLPVSLAYRSKDSHKVDIVAQTILEANPCYLSILALDLLDTNEARTLIIPCEDYKLRRAA